MRYVSESDYCRIEFSSLKEAQRTAELALAMISDLEKLKAMIRLADKEGLAD